MLWLQVSNGEILLVRSGKIQTMSEKLSPTPEEAEKRLTASQERYSRARKEWFDLRERLDIAFLPERIEVTIDRFPENGRESIISAQFGPHMIEVATNTLPSLDGEYRPDDSQVEYAKARVRINGEVLDRPRSIEMAQKMMRLYAAWEKMKTREREADQQAGPEAVAKDLFNLN